MMTYNRTIATVAFVSCLVFYTTCLALMPQENEKIQGSPNFIGSRPKEPTVTDISNKVSLSTNSMNLKFNENEKYLPVNLDSICANIELNNQKLLLVKVNDYRLSQEHWTFDSSNDLCISSLNEITWTLGKNIITLLCLDENGRDLNISMSTITGILWQYSGNATLDTTTIKIKTVFENNNDYKSYYLTNFRMNFDNHGGLDKFADVKINEHRISQYCTFGADSIEYNGRIKINGIKDTLSFELYDNELKYSYYQNKFHVPYHETEFFLYDFDQIISWFDLSIRYNDPE